MTKSNPSERMIIFIIGAIQFVNILDFMIVMPLGPDFSDDLGIDPALLGIIAGSYTLAAAISGIAGSFFLERFDRRRALLVALVGLVIATALAGLSNGLGTLVAARMAAGFFGGPATSLSIAVIADIIPPHRRGRAMGAVMGAFSVASIFGVPIGLELARLSTWRLAFYGVAAAGLFVLAGAWRYLPSMRGHLELVGKSRGLMPLLKKPVVLLSYTLTAAVMAAGFSVIPNISAFIQKNLGYPRDQIGLLYMVGGALSFASMRIAGRLVDRFGSSRTVFPTSIAIGVILYFTFIEYPAAVPVIVLFSAFMIGMGFRNVSYHALTSKVPERDERARFMSIQSAVQHLASSGGAMLAAGILSTAPDGSLRGMEIVTAISIALTLTIPFFMDLIERRIVSHAEVVIPPETPELP